MASFLDILRKLGIFRSGTTTATYKNAAERPLEMQDGGVFNEQKDVINPPPPEQTKQE